MRRYDQYSSQPSENLPDRTTERASLITKTRIHFRARTQNRWIDAVLVTAQRRLNDAINRDDLAGMLSVDDIEIVDQFGDFGQAIQRAPYGCINTRSVLFFVLVSEGASTAPRDAFAWIKKRSEQIKVGIGSYEITGATFMIEDAKLRDVISTPKPIFMVVTSATVRQLDGDGSTEEFGTVFVNKACIDYVMPVDAS
jgi:hypothetical protein